MCSRILLLIWFISNLDLSYSSLDVSETTQALLIDTKNNGKIDPESLEIFPSYTVHHSKIHSKNPRREELESEQDLFFKNFFNDEMNDDFYRNPFPENNISTDELFSKSLEESRKRYLEDVINLDKMFDTPVKHSDGELVTDEKFTETTHEAVVESVNNSERTSVLNNNNVHQTTKRSSEITKTDSSSNQNLTTLPLNSEILQIENNSQVLDIQKASDSNPETELDTISERETTDFPKNGLEEGNERKMDSKVPSLEALNVVTEISVQETINGTIVQRKPSSEELRSLGKEISGLSNINEHGGKDVEMYKDQNKNQDILDYMSKFQDHNNDQTRSENILDETLSNDVIDDLSSILKVDPNFTDDGIVPSDEEIKDLDMILTEYDEDDSYSNRKKDRPSTDDTYNSLNTTDTETKHDKYSASIKNEEEDIDESSKPKSSSNSEDKEDPRDYRKFVITEHKNSSNVRDVKITFSETEGDFLEDDDDDFNLGISENSEMFGKSSENINRTNSEISNFDVKQMNNPLIATNMEHTDNISESSEVAKAEEGGQNIKKNDTYLDFEKKTILSDTVTHIPETVNSRNFSEENSELGDNENKNNSILVEKINNDVDYFPTTEYSLTVEASLNITGKGQSLPRATLVKDEIINLRQNMSSKNDNASITVVPSSKSGNSSKISSNTTELESIFNQTALKSKDLELATEGQKESDSFTNHLPDASTDMKVASEINTKLDDSTTDSPDTTTDFYLMKATSEINDKLADFTTNSPDTTTNFYLMKATSEINAKLADFTTNSPDTTTDFNLMTELHKEFEALTTEFSGIPVTLDLTTEEQDKFDSFTISFSDISTDFDTVTDDEFDSFTSYLPRGSFTFDESDEKIDDIEHNFNLIKQILSENNVSKVENLDGISEEKATKTVKDLKNSLENITTTSVSTEEQSSPDEAITRSSSAPSGTSRYISITKLEKVPAPSDTSTSTNTSEDVDIITELRKNDQKETDYLISTDLADTVFGTKKMGLNTTNNTTTNESGIEHTTAHNNTTTQPENNNKNTIENDIVIINDGSSNSGSMEEPDLVPHEPSPSEVESLYNSKLEEYESMEEDMDKPLNEGDAWTLFAHKPVDYHRLMSGKVDEAQSTENYIEILEESGGDYDKAENDKDNFEGSDAAVDENGQEVYLVPILRGNILNNTAEFSVKISKKEETFFVPSSAHIQGNRDIINITWRAKGIFNNSIALRIFDKEEFFMIKEILINLLIGDEVILQKKGVAFSPDPVLDDSVSGKNRVVMMRDGTYIFFSNVDFLKKDVDLLEHSEASMRARRLWHIEIVSICLAVIVVIAIVFYVVAMKTKRKLSLREKSELNQVTHC